jgi:predicted dienelactone hydrolase
VIQPTHLSSRTLSLNPDDPEAPLYWRSRAEDMKRILDQLDAIETAVPQLPGRLDRSKVAIAGHSMGGHTASLLLGARLTDPHDGTQVNLAEPRIKAGVLLAAPGRGGDALTEFAAENYPFFSTTDFSEMTTPALVVAGDKDTSAHLTVAGADWHTDPYFLSTPRAPSRCSPWLTQSTGSAGSLDMTPPRPRTRSPSESLRSSDSPVPTWPAGRSGRPDRR